MMDDVLLNTAAKYGPVVLVAVILGQMVIRALIARYAPAPKPLPIPEDPRAPSETPVVDAALKAMFGKKAPQTGREANRELVKRMKEEVDRLHYR